MIRASIFCLAAALAPPATAQSIAFAQAPEQSSGVGTGPDIGTAIRAARAECVAGGAYAEDCLITAACDNAGWSLDVFAQHREGLHWHELFCGFSDEAVARAVGETVCNPAHRPDLIECAVVQIWDRDGNPQMEW